MTISLPCIVMAWNLGAINVVITNAVNGTQKPVNPEYISTMYRKGKKKTKNEANWNAKAFIFGDMGLGFKRFRRFACLEGLIAAQV